MALESKDYAYGEALAAAAGSTLELTENEGMRFHFNHPQGAATCSFVEPTEGFGIDDAWFAQGMWAVSIPDHVVALQLAYGSPPEELAARILTEPLTPKSQQFQGCTAGPVIDHEVFCDQFGRSHYIDPDGTYAPGAIVKRNEAD